MSESIADRFGKRTVYETVGIGSNYSYIDNTVTGLGIVGKIIVRDRFIFIVNAVSLRILPVDNYPLGESDRMGKSGIAYGRPV